MSYRRKAPAAKTLSVSQQLAKLCNGYSGNLSFQSHNAMALLTQVHKKDKPQYDQFAKNASAQKFIPCWAAKLSMEEITAPTYTLPLPAHFIHAEDTAESFEPRTFYAEKDVVDVLGKTSKGPQLPRCGLSGLFFAREEVVDNLQAAAADSGFSSPFWIRPDHPGLKAGYLQVRDGSESILISLTASVIGLGDVDGVHPSKLHPSLRTIIGGGASSPVKFTVPGSIPLGMNAFTGVVTANPFVRALPNRGLWISQDQLLHHNLKLPRRISQAASAFSVIEIDQWELFNADQLQVPGRLGLRKSLNISSIDGIFEPV